jgi:hypothetical protein
VVPAAILAVAYWPDRGPNLVNETGGQSALVSNLFAIAFGGALLLTAAAVVSLILRYRRSSAVQRQQIKWFALGAASSVPMDFLATTGASLWLRPHGPRPADREQAGRRLPPRLGRPG